MKFKVRTETAQNQTGLESLYQNLNHLVATCHLEGKFDSNEKRSIVVACLYIRLRNLCVAASKLLADGHEIETEILLRSAIENLVILKNVVSRTDYCEIYLGTQYRFRIKLLNAVRNNFPGVYSALPITQKLLNKWLDANKKFPFSANSDNLLLEQLAKRVGLEWHYAYPYRLFTAVAHIKPDSLQRICSIDPDGAVIGIQEGELFRCEREHLLLIAWIYLEGLGDYLSYFRRPKPIEFSEAASQMASLSPSVTI